MTEDESYRLLRSLLIAVDAESVVLGETQDPLTDIIHSHQTAPRPTGPHAVLTPLGSRDTGEGHALCYEDILFKGVPRVIEIRREGVEYGWRIDVFAHRAADIARAFRAALCSARAQLDLLPFFARPPSDITSDAQMVQQNWEGRAKLSVDLAAVRTQRTLIDVIETGHIDIAGIGSRPAPITTSLDFPKE